MVKESDGFEVKYFEVILDGDSKVLANIRTMVQRCLRVNPVGCSVKCVVRKVPELMEQQQRLIQYLAGDCCILGVAFDKLLVLKCKASEEPKKFFGALFRSSAFLKGLEVRKVGECREAGILSEKACYAKGNRWGKIKSCQEEVE